MSIDNYKTYRAISSHGNQILIPKEAFVVLAAFIRNAIPRGTLTLQYRDGEIVYIESVARTPVSKIPTEPA